LSGAILAPVKEEEKSIKTDVLVRCYEEKSIVVEVRR
jgi:hypothetical protein